MTIRIVTKNAGFTGRRRQGGAPVPFEYAPGYVFTEDPACVDYDWLVVFDGMRGDVSVTCPREHTILTTWEPVSIRNYNTPFTRQFGHLLTNRPSWAEKHPHYHLGRGYFPWMNGRTFPENKAAVIPPKTTLLTAVCSSKAMKWTNHAARIELLRRCQRDIPGMEWYGWGIRECGMKCDVTDVARYQIVFENHEAPHYWSEKIADAFLSECLPFYAGAPDLAADFPGDAFIPIPSDDPAAAVQIIQSAIANDEWTKRRAAIRAARELLFTRYNFFAQVIAVIEASAGQSVTPVADPWTLHDRRYFRFRSLRANLEDGWFHLRQYLSGVGLWARLS